MTEPTSVCWKFRAIEDKLLQQRAHTSKGNMPLGAQVPLEQLPGRRRSCAAAAPAHRAASTARCSWPGNAAGGNKTGLRRSRRQSCQAADSGVRTGLMNHRSPRASSSSSKPPWWKGSTAARPAGCSLPREARYCSVLVNYPSLTPDRRRPAAQCSSISAQLSLLGAKWCSTWDEDGDSDQTFLSHSPCVLSSQPAQDSAFAKTKLKKFDLNKQHQAAPFIT